MRPTGQRIDRKQATATEIIDQIVAGADGVPLFVEELTCQALESGLLREEDECYELAGPLPQAAIPATLQDSLMARLDRLAAAKDIAQAASVIGREFPYDLLAAIIAREEELAEALHQLLIADLVFRRGAAPHVTYVFKHALVRDAAYGSLLTGKRRHLHTRIAQALEEHYAQTVEAEPDVLAHHWTEAGEVEKAAVYRLKAGERALARSGTTEAITQLALGVELLKSLPDSDMRHRRELDLQIALGAALSATKGMAAVETAKAYGRASVLCSLVGEEQRLIPVLLGLWGSHNARDELGAARTVAAQLLKLGEQKGDAVATMLGHRALGATLFGLGEFILARTHLRQLLEPGVPTVRLSSVHLPYDPCVSGRSWLSLCLSVLGYPEQALAQADQALTEAEQLQHQNTLALVLTLRCSLGQYLRDHHDVARYAKALLALAVKREFAYWAGLAKYFQGWAQARIGEIDIGIEEMRRALAACQATGARAYVPYNVALLADMCRLGHDLALGRKLLDQAIEQFAQTDARYCEAELLCIDGDMRLAMPQPDRCEAEAAFGRAIEIARRQNAKAVELRAALCLARLWADGGERRKAYDLITPIYGWFTEGFNTYPLTEAKSLICELSS